MRDHDYDASAREGATNQFDVLADGATIFSMQREHRFPDEEEVLALLRGAAAER